MKKLIVIVASLLIAVSAHAQLGVIAGITSAQTKFENLDVANDALQAATQYHVGLTFKLGLGNLIAVQPAIIYNVKGSKFADIDNVDDFDFKNGYLEVPVQLQVGMGLGDLARVYAIAEPFVGMQISQQMLKETQDLSDIDFADKLEYGFGLGAGVELIKHVQVSVRYFWNLGGTKDANISSASDAINLIKDSASSKNANGVMASVALLF
jgi:hypothetical protein